MLPIRNLKAPVKHVSAPAAFTGAGIAAAFGAAACCALPALFAGAGLGTAWLTTVALAASPYRELLLAVAAASLLIGAILLWRQQQRATRACTPGGLCARPTSRLMTLGGLVAGAILLWLGYTYV